jgi:hypothetical protein
VRSRSRASETPGVSKALRRASSPPIPAPLRPPREPRSRVPSRVVGTTRGGEKGSSVKSVSRRLDAGIVQLSRISPRRDRARRRGEPVAGIAAFDSYDSVRRRLVPRHRDWRSAAPAPLGVKRTDGPTRGCTSRRCRRLGRIDRLEIAPQCAPDGTRSDVRGAGRLCAHDREARQNSRIRSPCRPKTTDFGPRPAADAAVIISARGSADATRGFGERRKSP